MQENKKIMLKVVYFYEIIKYTWDLEEATMYERQLFFRDTPRFGPSIEIQGANLQAGSKYNIKVTVEGEQGSTSQTLSIETITLPPITLSVVPLEGTAMETEFTLISGGWVVESPVPYKIEVIDVNQKTSLVDKGTSHKTITKKYKFPYVDAAQSVFTFKLSVMSPLYTIEKNVEVLLSRYEGKGMDILETMTDDPEKFTESFAKITVAGTEEQQKQTSCEDDTCK